MPGLRSDTFGTGDQRWLGSTHALYNARTETLNVPAFNAATHYPDGYIPSGTPVALVGGLLVPYDGTEGTTTGAGVLAGFVKIDVRIFPDDDRTPAALVDHGRIRTGFVPGNFVAPAAAAKRGATTFIFINNER